MKQNIFIPPFAGKGGVLGEPMQGVGKNFIAEFSL